MVSVSQYEALKRLAMLDLPAAVEADELARLRKLALDVQAMSSPHNMNSGGLTYSERLMIIQRLVNEALVTPPSADT